MKTELSQAQLLAIIDNSREAIALLDEKFHPIYRTPSAETITGWTAEERKKYDAVDKIHPDDSEILKSAMAEVLKNPKKPITTIFRTQHKSGHYIWLRTMMINLLQDESVKGIVVNFEDYTHRKKYEEQQVLFGSIVNSSNDAILSKSLDGKIMSWNYAAEEVFGYSSKEMIGNHISVLIPSYLENEEKTIIEKIIKGNSVSHYETERIRKDGKIIHVSLTISPIKDSAGNVIGASKILRDITERKNAAEKIAKSTRLYAFLSNVNQSIVHIKNEEALLDEICSIASGVGQFRMAWIGLLDRAGKLNIVSSMGDKENVAESWKGLAIDFSRTELKDTPVGKALSTGEFAVNNHVQNDPALKSWNNRFAQFDIKANISFPLKKFERVIGVLSLSSVVENFFDDDEIALLKEAVGDISFALENFEKTELHKKAEEKLQQSETKLNDAQAIAHVGSWEVDILHDALYWSDEQFNLLGLKKGEVAPSNELFLSMVHPDDFEMVNRNFYRTFEVLENSSSEFKIVLSNGTVKHVFCEWKFEFDREGNPLRVFGIVQDVTDKKLSEEKIIRSEIQIRNFARHLNNVQEEERAHIAREIHDELGQELVGIKIGLSAFGKSKLNPVETADFVKDMMATVDGSIQSLRKIATELRPGILDTLGLVSSIEWLGKEFERKTKIKCILETDIKEDLLLEKEVSICFFRICQEALTNISKHADPGLVKIKIFKIQDELILEIADDGKGISNEKIANPFSMGLLGMKERAGNISGILEIVSEIGKGTTIRLKHL